MNQPLHDRLAELEEENEDLHKLNTRQNDLLRGVVNALHNGPLKNGWWSHHDAPQLAAKAMQRIAELETERAKLIEQLNPPPKKRAPRMPKVKL